MKALCVVIAVMIDNYGCIKAVTSKSGWAILQISYMKSSAEYALYKRLIDLFIRAEMGAESGFISQTNQFPSIDHVV